MFTNREYLELEPIEERKAGRGWVKPTLVLLVAVGVVAALYTTQRQTSASDTKSLRIVGSNVALKSDYKRQIGCGDSKSHTFVGGEDTTDLYEFDVPLDVKSLTISTCNSPVDTVLKLYPGTTNTGTEQTYCDDCGECENSWNERLTLDAVASGAFDTEVNKGETYTVTVNPYDVDAGGDYTIVLSCELAGPSQPPTVPIPTARPTPRPTGKPTERPTRNPIPPTTARPTKLCPGGGRVRKAWHASTKAERMLYVNGIKALKANGKLDIFTNAHKEYFAFAQAHRTDFFLPWHRYFLWELENQMRKLGKAYDCFALPFWDWTVNAAEPYKNPMFDGPLGGDRFASGPPLYGCVSTGEFTLSNGYTDETGGCLRREHNADFTPLELAPGTISMMLDNPDYPSYRSLVEARPHGYAHMYIAGGGAQMGGENSPADPFFYLLHGMVDFQWAMWQSCHGYDEVDILSNPLIFPADLVNDELNYQGLMGHDWAYVNNNKVTPWDMHSIASFMLDYKYHGGDILARSEQSVDRCSFRSGNVKFDAEPLVEVDIIGDDIASVVRREARRWRKALYAGVSPDGFVIENVRRLNEKQIAEHIERRSCKYTRELCHKKKEIKWCRFSSDYEKCSTYSKHITLDEMLNKRGVKGNECLMRVRKRLWKWANRFEMLVALCNGRFDPECSD